SPVRVLALMVEGLSEPLPSFIGLSAGGHLHDRDDGHRALRHHAPEGLRMNGCLGALGAGTRRVALAASVMMGEQVDEDRADHRGVHEGADSGTGAGADAVELEAGLIELVVALDLPTHAVQV